MHREKFFAVCGELVRIFLDRHLPRAAAGLTYFLTLSFFPLLICLYHMLGSLFPGGAEFRALTAGFLPEETVEAIVDYLGYVSRNTSTAMLVMALGVLLTSASAAYRCVDHVTAEMRGSARFSGLREPVFSVVFSLVFLLALYAAGLLIVTGKWFLELLDRRIMFMNISDNWNWLRFLLLFFLLFVMLAWVYRATAPKRRENRRIRTLPGALAAATAMLLVSIVFSGGIGASARYPVVYGSLASLFLLMLWLYVCGMLLFLGNALNVALEKVS